MKSAQFFSLFVAVLCCIPTITLASDDEELGWQQDYVEKPGAPQQQSRSWMWPYLPIRKKRI
jgi:hypothetical protein